MTAETENDAPLWTTWGLFGAWFAHDLEEVFTMSAWSKQPHHIAGIQLPIPSISPLNTCASIGSMGVLVALASEMGRRSGGRSRIYQAALMAFGWHSVSHIAASVVLREYTPGSLTALPIVLPFYVAARRSLKSQGIAIPSWKLAPLALTLAVGSLAIAHGIGHVIDRTVSS